MKDRHGNIITSVPTSNPTFIVDNTPPTAAITYSIGGATVAAGKIGDTLVITATFNISMKDTPIPQLSLTSNDGSVSSVGATNMTKVSNTI